MTRATPKETRTSALLATATPTQKGNPDRMMTKKAPKPMKTTHPNATATTSTASTTVVTGTAAQAPTPPTPTTTTPTTQVTSVANSKDAGTKTALQTSYVALIAGLQATFAPDYVFELPMGSKTTTELVAMMQQFVQTAETTKSSYQSWRSDVQAERQVEQQVAPVRAAIKLVLQGRYGKSSLQLLPFGFLPQKVAQRSALSKTTAKVKNEATRAARGTVGSKKKLEITGNVTGVTITPITSTPATPSAPAPAAKPSAS
jgi:hypothetical protein